MGFNNKSASGNHAAKDRISSMASSGKEMASQKLELHKKQKGEISVSFHVESGKSLIPTSLGKATLWQQCDGLVYFSQDPSTIYNVIDFQWSGPQYRTVTHTETKGKEHGETKRKGRLLGAAVGTIVAPGLGTAIGAGFGTGNKKSDKNMEQSSVTYDQQIEIPTQAILILRNVELSENISITIGCTNSIGTLLGGFVRNPTQEIHAYAEEISDPYDEIKKVKELLDMGVITQEEFENKKHQLLNI
jgi:hypothetical protein